jgi:hypothetical protein
MSVVLLLAFLGLGVLIGVTWMAVEVYLLVTAGGIAVIGIIGSLISVVSTWKASQDNVGALGPFMGFYLVLLCFPALLAHGFYMLFYETDTEDYFQARYNDQEFWEEKYGDDLTLEDAIADADYKLLILSYAILAVSLLVFAATLVFALGAWRTKTMRVFVAVYILAIVLLVLVQAFRTMFLLNLFDARLLV